MSQHACTETEEAYTSSPPHLSAPFSAPHFSHDVLCAPPGLGVHSAHAQQHSTFSTRTPHQAALPRAPSEITQPTVSQWAPSTNRTPSNLTSLCAPPSQPPPAKRRRGMADGLLSDALLARAEDKPSSCSDTSRTGREAAQDGANGILDSQIHTMPYTCAHCAARFSFRSQRKLHMRMKHSKPFHCTVCQSRFTRKFDLEKHSLTVHEGARPYMCDICRVCFGQKHHLMRHKKAVHVKARDFQCDKCNAKFARKEHLGNHHRAVHDKFRPFMCALCDVQYAEKRALGRHLELMHSVKGSRVATLAAWQPDSRRAPPMIADILQM